MQSGPSRKRRRLAMPEFESSFDSKTEPSPHKWKPDPKNKRLLRDLDGFHTIVDDGKDYSGEKTRVTVNLPAKTLQVVKSSFSFPVKPPPSPSANTVKVTRHIPLMSAAFADFSSTFGFEDEKKKHLANITPNYAEKYDEDGIRIPTRDRSRTKPINVHETPFRVFAPPPQFQEPAVGLSVSPRDHKSVVTPVPLRRINDDSRKNSPLSSHILPKFSFASISGDGTPKKVISFVSPNVVTGDTAGVVTPSKMSHIERAGRLAEAARDAQATKLSDMAISDFMRGMDVSPQKDVGDRRKFVRHGLAERARHLLSKSRTNVVLWQTERSKVCLIPPVADLNLLVTSIITFAYHPSAIYRPVNSTNPRTILTTCSSLEEYPKTYKLVAFLLSSRESAVDFQVGRQVHICRPWHEIRISQVDREVIEGCLAGKSTVSHMEVDINALLCSRFSIT